MIERCTSKNHPCYHNYGGRGIKVCRRWLKLNNFLADMGARPPGMTIERKDNAGNYEPGNCRWATRTENNRNRRTNRRITYDGQTKTLAEWCEITGLRHTCIIRRLKRGWSLHRTFTTPAPNALPPDKRTACPHGHHYNKSNTYVRTHSDGTKERVCRECRRVRRRRQYAKKRASCPRS